MDIEGQIDVDLGVTSYLNVCQHGDWDVSTTSCGLCLSIKRPYLINPENVEYIEGDWNEDKTEYGIRIGYVSGRSKCFWGSTARKVLEDFGYSFKLSKDEREELCEKFDDRIKAGPPSV